MTNVSSAPEGGVHRSRQRMVAASGVDLCVQTFGDAGNPAILLIGGAAASMDWWEDGFCERLARGRRFVIRYDLRDTGQSSSDEPGAPDYDQLDLVADARGLLDALRISRAHVAGISMGGGIAQRLALDHPDRVASLILISTSPGGPGGPRNPDLPPMSDELASFLAEPSPQPDWSDRAAVIDFIVDGQRPLAGSFPFDEPEVRALAATIVDRTAKIASSMTNHWILHGGEPVRARLGEIRAPVLMIHGTEDPLFPYGHAESLAREIPGARLLPLERVGHQMPPRQVWDDVVAAILDHTAAAHPTRRSSPSPHSGSGPSSVTR
jgi:pimeloyl-ACP methyl ester carboxylesterase